MLKELSNIANGLLGLHGYPLQPVGSSAPREAASPRKPASVTHAAQCTPVAPLRTDTVVPAAALHC
jgi:hypothetical protein